MHRGREETAVTGNPPPSSEESVGPGAPPGERPRPEAAALGELPRPPESRPPPARLPPPRAARQTVSGAAAAARGPVRGALPAYLAFLPNRGVVAAP